MSGKATISSSAVELTFDGSESDKSKKKYAQRKKIAIWALVLLGLLAISLLIAVIVISGKLNDEKDETQRLEMLVGKDNGPQTTKKTTPEKTKAPITSKSTAHIPTAEPTKPTEPAEPKLGPDVLLPTALIPHLYEVEIQPNIYDGPKEEFTFDGCVKIHMECRSATHNITIHTRNLTLVNESLELVRTENAEHSYSFHGYTRDERREFMVFHLDEALVTGMNYTLAMNFSGPLIQDGRGLYYSEHKYGNESSFIASTQFEQTHARKSFPCLDQPDMKAMFDVSIVRHRDYLSLSNMPRVGSYNRSDDFVVDVFSRSVIMPTYLVAFLVCDYKYLQNYTSRDVKVRTWSRKEEYTHTKFALNVAINATESYEDFLQTDYPLPKQGQLQYRTTSPFELNIDEGTFNPLPNAESRERFIARVNKKTDMSGDHTTIPFFNAGAMENWGLIKYRETLLLYNPEVDTESRKFSVAQVVRHELAHMWFGNLVTCMWWSDIWLNEGFASYFEVISNSYLYNEWKPYDYLLVDAQRAMNADNFPTSRAIVADVWEDFSAMFDTITYQKGASILRQLHFIMGDEAFRGGLKRYLHAHAYGNTLTQDLFDALQQQLTEDGRTEALTDIMNTWVRQNNYPVVTVTRHANGNVLLTQHRYINDQRLLENDTTTSSHQYRWYIPFTYTTSSNVNFMQNYSCITWLQPDQADVLLENAGGIFPSPDIQNSWIIGNVEVTGFYRVNYDSANWRGIVHQLNTNHHIIDPRNRAQLINDAWNLADSDDIEIEQALDITDYLHNETDYIPWYSANNEFALVDRMLRYTEDYGTFEKYMLKKVEPVLHTLGMVNIGHEDSSKHLEIYVRNMMMSLACKYGSESCITTATDLFMNWIKNTTNGIDPNLRRTVYCTAVRANGAEAWEALYEIYKKTEYPAEKTRILYGLSCANHLWLIHKYVNILIHTNEIDVGEQDNALVYVSNNPIGRAVVVEAVFTKLHVLNNKTGFSLSATLSGIGTTFNTVHDEYKIEKLMEMPHIDSDLKKTLDTVKKGTKNRIRWMERFSEKIVKWMEGKVV